MNRRGRIRRYERAMLVGLGVLCVTLGTVGIFVPGLPTTVFLLLASWAFARSSPGLHRKLHAHPRLGEFLRMAQAGRMPRRPCIVSVAAIWGGIGLALVLAPMHSVPMGSVLLAAGSAGTAYLMALASRQRIDPRLTATPGQRRSFQRYEDRTPVQVTASTATPRISNGALTPDDSPGAVASIM